MWLRLLITGSQSSYLIHSLAFSFIMKPSSIILLIYMLNQACAGAITISTAFAVCMWLYVEKKKILRAPWCVAAIKF